MDCFLGFGGFARGVLVIESTSSVKNLSLFGCFAFSGFSTFALSSKLLSDEGATLVIDAEDLFLSGIFLSTWIFLDWTQTSPATARPIFEAF